MYDSLKIFGLGYAAGYSEVKAEYRRLSRIYHPDQHHRHKHTTGMTDETMHTITCDPNYKYGGRDDILDVQKEEGGHLMMSSYKVLVLKRKLR